DPDIVTLDLLARHLCGQSDRRLTTQIVAQLMSAMGGKLSFGGVGGNVLVPLGSDLWFADGSIVSFNGFAYPTRMVIVRLASGGLWLWSPVQKTASIETEVRALGPFRHIVSPNK